MKRIEVGVLGATGTVGQRFVQLLENHPWFKVAVVTGSERTVGQRYAQGVNWVLPGEIPSSVANLRIEATSPNLPASLLFSALPTAEARELEPRFAAAGHAVVTNASAHRMAEYVPLLIPEINPTHTEMIRCQRENNGWSGFIVASPNCSTTSAVLPMKIFQDTFGLQSTIMTTMQAISGAGYPGVSSMEIMDNVIPHIGGEDQKLETEPRKLLGQVVDGELSPADIALSAQANRVPVIDGHLVSLSVGLEQRATVAQAIEALHQWRPPQICASLPSSPAQLLIYRHEADRPQPRLDRDSQAGMAWTVGKVRECGVLDLRLMTITHNTLRGAASGAILNAELLVSQGYLT